MITKRSGRALILGLGSSGIAAAKLLKRQGWSVTAIEENPAARSRAEQFLEASELAGDLTSGFLAGTDFAIISPGIPAGHPWLEKLRGADIPVIPEFEYGLSAMPGVRVVAVTGSNGKSSLVKWISDTMNLAGISSLPAGNYGLPPCEVALSGKVPSVLVLELSSFQLEQAVSFSPEIGLLLNLAPNHLDRHVTMEQYRKAKARMFAHASGGSMQIVHAPAWEEVRRFVPSTCKPVFFGEDPSLDYYARGGSIHSRKSSLSIDLSGTWWGRMPLIVNACSAMAVFEHFQIAPALVRQSASQFKPLPHRLEYLGQKKGVAFINDSKCSTMTALAAALRSVGQKKHLIAGGILKEADVVFLKELLAETCTFVYCIGAAADRLVESWRDAVPCKNCGDLTSAFAQAAASAGPGEVVLLSPGCSSFDQFASYAQRGDLFRKLFDGLWESP